jgi:type 1 glutamine amidotransferase
MTLTGARVVVVGAALGVAMAATTIGQAQGPGPQGTTPAVGQAPGAPGQGAGRGAGRGGGRGGRGGPQPQAANPVDVAQMLAAVPSSAPATPAQARRVLVLARAASFVHSSIPLASRTIEALGGRTGAWTTVITFDPADITAENLAGYDAVFLASTTGAFLDDANDPAVSEARRKALMDFVSGGKGLGGIHAATDSYRAQGQGTWPEFNRAIGGWFKWHWNNGTQVQVKVEDVNHPINASLTRMNAQTGERQAIPRLRVQDEIYTFPMNAWDRSRIRVLTSIDYDAMPAEVKAQEPENGRRTDGDYPLSYIQRVGNGRVFVQLLGHDESHYKIPMMLEHLLAGMQYAIGDLKVDDSPRP